MAIIKWSKKEAIRHITELKNPFEEELKEKVQGTPLQTLVSRGENRIAVTDQEINGEVPIPGAV